MVWTQARTAQRAQLKIHKIQSLGGNIRGARRGVLRQRLVTARPGRPGKSLARHYDLAARSSLNGSKPAEASATAGAGDASAAPGEKPPRVERRETSARVMGRKAPRKRLACRVMCRPNGCSAEHPNVSRRSAHPSVGVSEAKVQAPGAKNAPRERDGLFEIVRWNDEYVRACVSRTRGSA